MNTTIKSTLTAFDNSSEAGMATAEYAIGTVAATSIAGILVWLSKQEWLKEGIVEIFKAIFKL